MGVGKKLKRGCTLALVILLGLSCLIHIQTQAAVGIETGKKCSLTISTDILPEVSGDSEESSDNADLKDDLNKMKIPVALYKVADVNVSGKYTPVEPFKEMNFSGINSETSAETWLELAQMAAESLSSATPVGTKDIEKKADNGKASVVFEGLTTGLYLVVPEETYNKDYTVLYRFTPYLTALPSNNYYKNPTEGDAWIYDTEIGLKPESVPLFGRLNITKILSKYNETLGPATFVFEIEGQDKKTKEVVYSNVISITYDKPDTQSVTLGGIPAGLEVKVTEVYSGASYKLDSSKEQNTVIVSDEAVDAEVAEMASVSFTNDYAGGNRGGYGVTNHFDSDGKGGWTWVKSETSPSTPAKE